MKKILLLAIAIAFYGSTFAQGIRYQGEVNVGYSVGVGDRATDRIPIHVINGVRFNKYLSAGIGLGVEYHCVYKKFMESSTMTIPIYLNVKGYLPAGKVVSPFVGMDLGYNVGVGDYSGLGGLMVTPHVGVSFKVARKSAINFSVGYAYQSMKGLKGGLISSDSAISMRIGYQF